MISTISSTISDSPFDIILSHLNITHIDDHNSFALSTPLICFHMIGVLFSLSFAKSFFKIITFPLYFTRKTCFFKRFQHVVHNLIRSFLQKKFNKNVDVNMNNILEKMANTMKINNNAVIFLTTTFIYIYQ